MTAFKTARVRSIFKSATWRIVGSCDTMLVSWLVTGCFKLAVSIGGVEVFTKMMLYYLHERIWDKFNIGRK